jgi:hypothetical protein
LSFIFCFSFQQGQSQCTEIRTLTNQLSVSLNQTTRILSISGLNGCDFCYYDTQEEVEACTCHEDCSIEADDWLLDCLINANSEGQIMECYASASQIKAQCISENQCPEFIPPTRTPVNHQYAVQIWHNTGFVEDFQGDPNEVIVIDNPINGAPPNTINVELTSLPNGNTVSFCYFTEVLIEFDDGTCCYYVNSGCEFKG